MAKGYSARRGFSNGSGQMLKQQQMQQQIMKTVSYTHLDVYKRQSHGTAAGTGKGRTAGRRIHSGGRGTERVKYRHVPVSYTHLDVYKRQTLMTLIF